MTFCDWLLGCLPLYRRLSGRSWYLCRVDGMWWWYPDHPPPNTEWVLRVEEFHGR